MSSIRETAVAGFFYPGDADELEAEVRRLLAAAEPGEGPAPKALIVPHAGYEYSGAVAASGYRLLEPAREQITRVVLIGPAHRVGGSTLMAHSANCFATPLGRVYVDPRTKMLPNVVVRDDAHAREHSLEVHLPFLQIVLGEFQVVPLLVGHVPADAVAETLEAVWGGPETVVIVSSDLSHFHEYEKACKIDRVTADAIVGRHAEEVAPHRACGAFGVAGLLTVARRRDLDVSLVDLRNSGDTAGTHDRVVGYGTFAVG